MKPVLFWDFDGTLASRGKLFASSLRMALDERSAYPQIAVDDMVPLLKNCLPWHTPDIAHTDIASTDDWWERLLYPATDSALVRCGVAPEHARAFSAASRKYAVLPELYLVYEDTMPAMARAAGLGLRQFILSNHVPELPEITKALGLLDYAEQCVTSAAVGYEKPHPKLYETALALAGHPQTAWMVGDNLRGDVLGAERCGLKAILVRKPGDAAAVLCSPGLSGAIDIIEQSMVVRSRRGEQTAPRQVRRPGS
jgi:putative hydrolase of the HAD superfamily